MSAVALLLFVVQAICVKMAESQVLPTNYPTGSQCLGIRTSPGNIQQSAVNSSPITNQQSLLLNLARSSFPYSQTLSQNGIPSVVQQLISSYSGKFNSAVPNLARFRLQTTPQFAVPNSARLGYQSSSPTVVSNTGKFGYSSFPQRFAPNPRRVRYPISSPVPYSTPVFATQAVTSVLQGPKAANTDFATTTNNLTHALQLLLVSNLVKASLESDQSVTPSCPGPLPIPFPYANIVAQGGLQTKRPSSSQISRNIAPPSVNSVT